MNYNEIIDILREEQGSLDDYLHKLYRPLIHPILGEIKTVEHYGGEGKGEDYYSIHLFVDHNIYIKFQGFYSSAEGADIESWDDVTQVEPKEITVMKYLKVS